MNTYTKSREEFARAVKVIPSGIYGHQGPAEGCFIPVDAFPMFSQRAKGSYFWDVDGNRFIDYMCAYGPNILGYCDEDVNAAAMEQMALGDCITAPSYKMVELAELNFDRLNADEGHPSRDWSDTFYFDEDSRVMLRSQTSPMQVRAMDTMELPIRIIAPGRVYRKDEVDATHSPMFHQVEGMVIDKHVTMADLKGTLNTVVEQLYGKGTKTRFRPHHFPFTEPSCEMDVQCHKCGGVGCPTCKGEGWIELLGAGMIHPRVLEMSGIDPNVYSGWAFGIGLERTAMRRFKIADLRLIFENDVRFLEQF